MVNNTNPTTTLMANESKLAQAEAERYVEQQKSANFYTKIADYMFWGATSIILPVLSVGLGIVAAPAMLGTAGVIGIGAAASALTFGGSLFFSRKATEISEQSNVLYSDIDSQNQARRMVQGFARAQSHVQHQDTAVNASDTSVPFTDNGNWQERTGKAATYASWQERMAAQADREDALALEQLSH